MSKRNDTLMEIITVRLNSSRDAQAFQEILRELAKASEDESQAEAIKLYRSEQVESDWAIHLSYPIARKKTGKSSLAAHLAEVLHLAGLVQHRRWRSCALTDSNRFFNQ